MRESLIIIDLILNNIPIGDIKLDNKKLSIPSKSFMKYHMDSLIHHFKLYTEGNNISENSVYISTETPKGENSIFLLSNNTNMPYRCHIKAPGFLHLQSLNVYVKSPSSCCI